LSHPPLYQLKKNSVVGRMINECGAIGGMRIDKENPRYSEKDHLSAALPTTSPT
jgi:hypothetical protein